MLPKCREVVLRIAYKDYHLEIGLTRKSRKLNYTFSLLAVSIRSVFMALYSDKQERFCSYDFAFHKSLLVFFKVFIDLRYGLCWPHLSRRNRQILATMCRHSWLPVSRNLKHDLI